MEIIKYTSSEIMYRIRHNLRELPDGKRYGNEDIDKSLSHTNYSLISRGENAREVTSYRKEFEKEIFKYNRRNLVHAIEVVIQCPSDCPPEQHEAFFRESYNYIVSTLPAGESCVFMAQVHRDEHKYVSVFEGGVSVSKDISKEHLHIMYTPAVFDEKHDGYTYRLCADQLTKKSVLRGMHPGLQSHLDSKGIQATVFRKKEGDGKTIGLSVSQLKEITEKTGIVVDHSLTVDELAQILLQNHELQRVIDSLTVEKTLQESSLIEHSNDASHSQILVLQEHIETLQKAYNVQAEELEVAKEKIKELEAAKVHSPTPAHTWGADASWGKQQEWGTTVTKNYTVEDEKIF